MNRAALRWFPNALSATRLAVAPILLLCAALGSRLGFALALGLALATDAIDGPVARAMGSVTVTGARLDSWGDFALYTTGPLVLFVLWPAVIAREAGWVVAVVSAFVTPIVLGFIKFRRLTSYHTWAAKTGAVLLAVALVPLLRDGPAWPFHVAALVLVWVALEEMAITLTLPHWRADVPTIWHARYVVRVDHHQLAPGAQDTVPLP